VLMAVAEQAFEANRVYMDEAYEAEGTVVERMRRVASAYVRFALERPHEFQLLAFPAADAPTEPSVAVLVHEQNGKLAALIRQGIAEGVAADDLDPELAATALWQMYDGVIGLAFRPDELRVPLERLPALMKTVEAIVESGLVAR
jgi:AcrR family transcriptional regulator